MTPAAYIRRHPERLLRRLRHLVGLRTVNPPGENYGPITAWLETELRAVGLQARRHRIPDRLLRAVLPPAQHGFPRYNVLGKLRAGPGRRTLHFNAHYDVVPVSGRWRHGDPFSGRVAGGWIHGRGTADMKGSIASLLLALEALRATGTPPRMNVEVSFTADEETDSALGAAWLVRHAPIAPDYALVMEGGEGRNICCGHNGTLWLEIEVRGRAAHGSTPHKGENALERMAALVGAFTEYKRRLAARPWRTPEGRLQRPTVNLGGVFHCGEGAKINTVPAHASFTVDRRVLPGEDLAAAERELRAFVATAARGVAPGAVRVRKLSENHACFTPPDHPFFSAVAGCVAGVRGGRTRFSVSTGFNDMHFFSHHLGIPTLGYGPGGEDCHAVDERARVRDLLDSARIYAALLTTFAG